MNQEQGLCGFLVWNWEGLRGKGSVKESLVVEPGPGP